MKSNNPNVVVVEEEYCTPEVLLFSKNVYGDVTITRNFIENEVVFEFTNSLGRDAFKDKFKFK